MIRKMVVRLSLYLAFISSVIAEDILNSKIAEVNSGNFAARFPSKCFSSEQAIVNNLKTDSLFNGTSVFPGAHSELKIRRDYSNWLKGGNWTLRSKRSRRDLDGLATMLRQMSERLRGPEYKDKNCTNGGIIILPMCDQATTTCTPECSSAPTTCSSEECSSTDPPCSQQMGESCPCCADVLLCFMKHLVELVTQFFVGSLHGARTANNVYLTICNKEGHSEVNNTTPVPIELTTPSESPN